MPPVSVQPTSRVANLGEAGQLLRALAAPSRHVVDNEPAGRAGEH
ncbi:MAG: hypothetical protein ABJB98_08370 [Actinomycetota bacterium]